MLPGTGTYKKELDICTKDNIEPRQEQLTA